VLSVTEAKQCGTSVVNTVGPHNSVLEPPQCRKALGLNSVTSVLV
jgi:hypothetical protein